MSKFKIINFANSYFFGAALLATAATYSLNPTRAEASSLLASNQQLSATVAGDRNLPAVAHNKQSATLASIVESESGLLLAQATSGEASEKTEGSQNKLLRPISLAFLLLFFVPLGIFYPLFLFYRMLLVKPAKSNSNLKNEQNSDVATKSSATNSYASSATSDITKATVSKLQIAFSPPARELRKELSRVSSTANLKSEDNIVELMHQTIDVLIEQGHWTHISHSSDTFPLSLVKPEFDNISDRERYKFNEEQPGLINYNRNVSSSEGYERNYSYVVVTLILCTSHPVPLFETISTQEQLVKELGKLRQIEENKVIKFELLWNPQQEDIYISNDQLLIEYEEMTRLL